jgi:hypothetical protein
MIVSGWVYGRGAPAGSEGFDEEYAGGQPVAGDTDGGVAHESVCGCAGRCMRCPGKVMVCPHGEKTGRQSKIHGCLCNDEK